VHGVLPHDMYDLRERDEIAKRYRGWKAAIQPFIQERVKLAILYYRPRVILQDGGNVGFDVVNYPPAVTDLFKMLDEEIVSMAKAYGFQVQTLEDGHQVLTSKLH